MGIITKNYLHSVGGIEGYSKINETLKDDIQSFIPLFFEPINEFKKTAPILASIQGIDFTIDYQRGLQKLLEDLLAFENESAKEKLSKIEGFKTKNPFRRVRAEFFRGNEKLLAQVFAIPEKKSYDLLLEDNPLFIFGGRGCGKTMLLKSLTPRVYFYRKGIKTYKEAREKGVRFLGFYFRLEKGSLLIYDNNPIIEMGFIQTGFQKDYDLYKKLLNQLNAIKIRSNKDLEEEPILTAGLNAGWAISLNEINLKILKTILIELTNLADKSQPVLTIEKHLEEKISEEIFRKLGVNNRKAVNFEELKNFIDNELLKISNYFQDLCTPFTTPKANWQRTSINFLDEVFSIISNNLIDLKDVTFYLLFDEFENLRPFQQTIIIEWVKTAKYFVPKVASKFEGMYTNQTLQGQPLQYGEDCPHPIEIDYDLFDINRMNEYKKMLKKICSNLLEIEGYKNTDINDLLEVSKDPEIPQETIDKEIQRIRETNDQNFDKEKIRQYRNKLQMATIFRLLKQKEKVKGRKSKKKEFAGFNTFTYLSSGIIRIFLNLVGMALYIAEEEKINVKNGEKISIKNQTFATYIISRAWLEKIPENYDFKEYGEQTYQFIVDIGDILEERLLHHPTEPESLHLTLIDPINLIKAQNKVLDSILHFSERESILYKRKESTAYKPKQSTETRVREYILNRIYAPILGISYRARWGRNNFSTDDLMELLDENKRKKTLSRLKNRIKRVKSDDEYFLSEYFEVERVD